MLTTTIQWYSLGGSLIFLLLVLNAVRNQHLREAYALIWVFLAVFMIFVSIWTHVLKLVSNLLGIVYPPATLFLLLIVGILLLLFQYSIVISMHHEKIMKLTQEIALLKERVERLQKNNPTEK